METSQQAPHRITFGDDGSLEADAAWRWLTAQAWPGWRVDVLQAGAVAEPGGTAPRPRHAPRRSGFRSVRTIRSALNPRASLAMHQGSDLLVIGSAAAGPLRRVVVGDMAAWLLGNADLPIIIARDGGPVRSVLACMDGSLHARIAVDSLVSLPWAERSLVTVLTVLDTEGTNRSAGDEAADVLTTAGIRTQVRIEMPEPTIATASPIFKILETIDQLNPDLVVVGHGASKIATTVLGSVALDVTRQATCSVLVGPSPA